MITVAGCKILDKIFESDVSSIFRAVRLSDSEPVVLKMQRKDHPSPNEIFDFKYEYQSYHLSRESCRCYQGLWLGKN